jgi:hypothetical protein
LAAIPENATFNGEPMWRSYLREIDVVMQAALSRADYQRFVEADGGSEGLE